jgi:5'-nucleotidase
MLTNSPMINWSEIDTVLLDMDGTLLDLSFDNYFWLEYLPLKYSQHHKMDLETARIFLEKKSESLKGSLDWYCLDRWSEDLDLDIEAMKYEIRHLIRFRAHSEEFIAFLNGLGKELILLTNAHPKSLNLKAETSGLDNLMDTMISSHEFSLAKENAGFWQRLKTKVDLDLHKCLFIDDSVSVLQRARDEGVRHTVQILQPDSGVAALSPADFLGIVHFPEIMTQ